MTSNTSNVVQIHPKAEEACQHYRVVFTISQLKAIGIEYLALKSNVTGRLSLNTRYVNGLVDSSFRPNNR